MSNDRWYNPSDNYLLDDLSGFKIRASRSRRIAGGQTGNAIVAPEHWEPQQPQDFVRGVVDDQTVAIARPRQANVFIMLSTIVSGSVVAHIATIPVQSTAGFTVGMYVQLMLDGGDSWYAWVVGISGSSLILSAGPPTAISGKLENQILVVPSPAAGALITNTDYLLVTNGKQSLGGVV